jgi:hypothetical protein
MRDFAPDFLKVLNYIEEHPGCKPWDITQAQPHDHSRTGLIVRALLSLQLVKREWVENPRNSPSSTLYPGPNKIVTR